MKLVKILINLYVGAQTEILLTVFDTIFFGTSYETIKVELEFDYMNDSLGNTIIAKILIEITIIGSDFETYQWNNNILFPQPSSHSF